MNKTVFHILGVMSGSSLDGFDLAICSFRNENQKVQWKVKHAITIEIPQNLKQALSEKENLNVRLENFELVETEGGAVVHQSKTQPVHYVCPACVENRKEVHPLQSAGMMGRYLCPACSATYPVNKMRR